MPAAGRRQGKRRLRRAPTGDYASRLVCHGDRKKVRHRPRSKVVRHVSLARSQDEQGAALLDAVADVRADLVGQHIAPEIAKDDDVELAPVVASLWKRSRLGLAKGPRRVSRTRRGAFASRQPIRLDQHVLEMHGLVAPEEEVAQVPELPSRPPVRDEDVRAIVGNRDLERPFVVPWLRIPFRRLDHDAIALDSLLSRIVGESNVLRPGIGIHVELLAVERRSALGQFHGNAPPLEAIRPDMRHRTDLVAEKDV